MLGASAAALLVLAPSSSATFPGRDGLIAIHYFRGGACSDAAGCLTDDGVSLIDARGRTALDVDCCNAYASAFSPDGRWLAFTRFGSLLTKRLGPPRGRGRVILRMEDIGSPAWSPGGGALVFDAHEPGTPVDARQFDLYTVRRDGTGVVSLVPGIEPSWSARDRIVFTCAANVQGHWRYGGICVVAAKGGSVRRLVSRGSAPDWSPEGRHIAFTDRGGIYVVDTHGRGRRRVTTGRDPAWAPAGRRMAFERKGSIYTAGIDGRDSRRLLKCDNCDADPEVLGFAYSDPAWQPLHR